MWSTSSPEIFLIGEYKKRREGFDEFKKAIRATIDSTFKKDILQRREVVLPNDPSYVINPYGNQVPSELTINKEFFIFYDPSTGGDKFAIDMRADGFPMVAALKQNKDVAVELLQDDIRAGFFKLPEGESAFKEECLYTIFERNDKDELTRIIDDSIYHPDVADSILYALRNVWLSKGKEIRGA
jgi:hypothetical protein